MNAREKIEKALEVNVENVEKRITSFIRNKIDEAGAEGAVIGLSGGLDSTTVSFLSAEALDGKNVLTIFMPEEGITEKANAEDAERVSETVGTEYKEVEISGVLDEIKKEIDFSEGAKLANANLKPRIRMVILYYYANMRNYLVVGGSNKSELKCGYFTKYGDGAADILPQGDLYKSQLRKLAENLGVPKSIIDKKPTAGLWKGQKDEDELGLPYDKIDRIYTGLDLGLEKDEIAEALNIEESKVAAFERREQKSKHKTEMPPIPKL